MWGPVLYVNTLSLPPMLLLGLLGNERARLPDALDALQSMPSNEVAGAGALVALSCAAGCAISYLGWRARALVTATCYTVLGVANKMVTVLVNALLFGNQRASPAGVACLVACLVAASLYQQAPMREASPVSPSGGGGGTALGHVKYVRLRRNGDAYEAESVEER